MYRVLFSFSTEFIYTSMLVFLSRIQDRGGEMRFVDCIGEMLGFEAECTASLVFFTTFAFLIVDPVGRI